MFPRVWSIFFQTYWALIIRTLIFGMKASDRCWDCRKENWNVFLHVVAIYHSVSLEKMKREIMNQIMDNDILSDTEIFLLADLNSCVNFNEAHRGKMLLRWNVNIIGIWGKFTRIVYMADLDKSLPNIFIDDHYLQSKNTVFPFYVCLFYRWFPF